MERDTKNSHLSTSYSPTKIGASEIKKLMEVEGKVRGVVFRTDLEYVREKKGEEGLQSLRERVKELGLPIDYDKIKVTSWYPAGLRALSLLVIRETFNFGDEEIQDMGNSAPKYSFVVKILIRHFISFERFVKETPKYWEKHWTIGRLEPYKFSEKEKYTIIRLHNFKIHPIICTYLFENGYFMKIAQYIVKGRNFSSKETRCIFKGDPYHECLVTWE